MGREGMGRWDRMRGAEVRGLEQGRRAGSVRLAREQKGLLEDAYLLLLRRGQG